MIEILALFRTVLELCTQLGRHSGRRLLQPMLTALCVTTVYTAIHVSQEGGFVAGIRAAFLDNESNRTERRRTQEVTVLQGELRQFVAANKLIDQLLQTLLAHAPGASRIQLNVIHNGVTGLTGTGLLRYDLANSVAAPGRTAGPAYSNQPLSDWSDYLPAVMVGRCLFRRVSTLDSASLQARFEALGAVAALVCPAGDIRGKIVGAIFLSWDANDPIPDNATMEALMAEGQHLGGQIAAILDVRGPPPWSIESQSMR
jgi:hypothetical protein